MTVELALESFERSLNELQEAVGALHVTIIEDRPAQGAVMLVDKLENTVTELLGTLEEANARRRDLAQNYESNGPLEFARRALSEIHTLFNRFAAQYIGGLAVHEPVARMLEMGRERGREWRQWSEAVKTAVERCMEPMNAVASALEQCWSEQAERMSRGSVSVQATNIGQQITVREDELKAALHAA